MVQSYYGQGPLFSYWNGCSQGGRQGLALAQKYPDAYDGIAAGAPALFFDKVAATIYWPQQFMNNIGQHQYGCELDAIVLAAISECDGLDGIVDGVISDIDACTASFDPFSVAGQSINCAQTNNTIVVSKAAASVVNETWAGISRVSGGRLWHGYRPGADLTGDLTTGFGQQVLGPAATDCAAGVCAGIPNDLATAWVRLFLAKDPDFNLTSMTGQQFDNFIQNASREYQFLSTTDPDLSKFRDLGGKMVTYHGLVSSRNARKSQPRANNLYRRTL